MIELRQLEYFCEVVRSGSISKASAVLAVAQPALSRHIRRLEEDVGAELFYRNGRGVALTEGGVVFHGTATDILANLKSACQRIATDQSTPRGVVTLGLPPSLSGLIGAPILKAMQKKWPELKLHISDGFSGHINEWLLSGRVDLAILHEARQAASITTEHLVTESLFLVGRDAPPGAVQRDGRPVIPLAGTPTLPLILTGRAHGMRRQLDRIFGEVGISLDANLEVDALATIKELVLADAGYAILPIGCVHREVCEGRLRVWRLVDPLVGNTMVLAVSQNRPFTAGMQEVRRAIKDEIALLLDRGLFA